MGVTVKSAEAFLNTLRRDGYISHTNADTPALIAALEADRAAVAAKAYAQGVEDAPVMAERAAKFGTFTEAEVREAMRAYHREMQQAYRRGAGASDSIPKSVENLLADIKARREETS